MLLTRSAARWLKDLFSWRGGNECCCCCCCCGEFLGLVGDVTGPVSIIIMDDLLLWLVVVWLPPRALLLVSGQGEEGVGVVMMAADVGVAVLLDLHSIDPPWEARRTRHMIMHSVLTDLPPPQPPVR